MNIEDEENGNFKTTGKKWRLSDFKRRVPYYIPILGWGLKYSRNDFFNDFVAGMTVSFVMIPQALGLSSLALLPPIYGLYTAFVPLILYSVFGTSRHLSVGPEAAVSLMTGQVLVGITEDPTYYPQLANTICFFVGVFALVAGIFRLGFLDSILSKPMTSGFVTAVACIIMIEQMLNLLGIHDHWDEADSAIVKLIFVFQHITTSNPYTCAIGIPGLAFLFIYNQLRFKYQTNKVLQFFPFVLFLVIASILISWGFHLEDKGVEVLGDIKGGFQTPAQFKFEHTEDLISGSLIIAIVGFIESVVCAKKFADKNGYSISDNRELVALGMANTLGGVFGAYPANGALSRTNLNDAIGGRTQISSLICAISILLTILFLLPLFYHLPKCITASIVFFAGFGLLEADTLRFLIKIRAYSDIVLFALTLIVTLAMNIQIGVLSSIGISLGLIVKEVTMAPFHVIGENSKGKFKPIQDGNDIRPHDDITIIQFKESLFYAKIGFLRDNLRRVEKYRTLFAHPSDKFKSKPLFAVVFDISRMTSIDASALKLMIEIIQDYLAKNIRVCFVQLNPKNIMKFQRSGLMKMVGNENFFEKTRDAVNTICHDLES